MADDLLSALSRMDTAEDRLALRLFLERIAAWQAFMGQDNSMALSAEAELGLFGELTFLAMLLDKGVAPRIGIFAWRGPLGSPQDFVFAKGSVEVKSTHRVGAFPAFISSLEQLDDSLAPPLFLAALRFTTGAAGRTLDALIKELRRVLAPEVEAAAEFDSRLLHAGVAPSNG